MDNKELVLDYYSLTIPAWAICPIEYGEYDGLNDSEIEQVEDFIAHLDHLVGHSLFTIEYGEEVYFRNFNDFHNLGADCVDCKVYFTTTEEG